MILKKVHDVKDGKSQGILGIEVKRADKGVQRLTQRWIDEGISEGWLTFGKGKMAIAGTDGETVLELHVVRIPGHYCCHCGEKLPSDPMVKAIHINLGDRVETVMMTTGQQHVAEKHGGIASPDPTNPAGYTWETFYTVVNPGEVNNITREEAVEFEAGFRKALHDKIHKSMRAAKKAG